MDGSFQNLPQPDFEKDKNADDACALFFDFDSDGDADLLVCGGACRGSVVDHSWFRKFDYGAEQKQQAKTNGVENQVDPGEEISGSAEFNFN